MPGARALAKDLGVDRNTVEAALRRLEEMGLLVGQGAGRKRRIELPSGRKALASMKIAVLTHTAHGRQLDYMTDLKHSLAKAGHQVFSPHAASPNSG